jgi:quercetin dioxygenase-like cupin family protein
MNRTWKTFILITIAAATMSCSQPETEEPQIDVAPAAAETGPDPTVVDADHYKTEFENELVRVVRITYGPGEESVMHYHPDSVGVFLTDQHTEFGNPDGTSEEVHAEAGQYIFVTAAQHLPKNIGEEAMELVLVELKTVGPETAPAAAEETGPDPTVVDADHYKVELENERVRVIRITYGPGEESVMHYHPNSVAVFLTDHHVEFGRPDGTSEEAHVEAGEHAFAPAEQHLPKNIGEEPLELILIDIKG